MIQQSYPKVEPFAIWCRSIRSDKTGILQKYFYRSESGLKMRSCGKQLVIGIKIIPIASNGATGRTAPVLIHVAAEPQDAGFARSFAQRPGRLAGLLRLKQQAPAMSPLGFFEIFFGLRLR